MAHQIEVAADDHALIVAFAGCSLDEKPGSNWVQEQGGLPEYICEVARAIKRSGKSTSQAIAIAVSRIKKWAAGVGVDKDTQAKAAKALAEWEKKKAASHADNAKDKVKATVDDLLVSDKDLLFAVAWTHPCTVGPSPAQQLAALSALSRRTALQIISPSGS